MPRPWCPMCDQGWVVPATVNVTGQAIWVCDECDALWFGEEPPSRECYDTLGSLLSKLGLPELWTQITLRPDAST
jgi:hypothetical protein